MKEINEIEIPEIDKEILRKIEEKNEKVNIYTDGASKGNPGQGGIGIWINQGDEKRDVLKIGLAVGTVSNNTAEWLGLFFASKISNKQDLKNVNYFMDSKLIINQMNEN